MYDNSLGSLEKLFSNNYYSYVSTSPTTQQILLHLVVQVVNSGIH